MANPIHPGEILLEEYLTPLGVSQNKLARSLSITPKTISEIVLGKRGISPEMSIRLGKFFSQSPRFWLNLQTEYDFRCALRAEKRLTADVRVLKDLLAAWNVKRRKKKDSNGRCRDDQVKDRVGGLSDAGR